MNAFDSNNPERDVCLAACGFLCMLTILTLKSPPLPMSPHWLVAILDGIDAFALDEEFLRVVDEEVQTTCQAFFQWTDRKSKPSNDVKALITRCYMNVGALLTPMINDTYDE